MGLRYRKSVKIAKGVRVNLSKSGASLSLGGKGHSVNLSSQGARFTAGIPGTGLSYTKSVPLQAKKAKGKKESPSQTKQSTEKIIVSLEQEIDIPKVLLEMCPVVKDVEQFHADIDNLKAEEYTIPPFSLPSPDEHSVRKELEEEAQKNINGFFLTVEGKRKKYVKDNLLTRLDQQLDEWSKKEKAYRREQEEIRDLKNQKFEAELKKKKTLLSLAETGTEEAVFSLFDEWINALELPVEIGIDYDWQSSKNTMFLDIDLPEIEDLSPTVTAVGRNGTVIEKKKTQAELKKEYSRTVFAIALFITTNVFQLSSTIEHVLISGYTQRRRKEGDLYNCYIYSIHFDRNQFINRTLSESDPLSVCMEAENRCRMTTTGLLQEIKPYIE